MFLVPTYQVLIIKWWKCAFSKPKVAYPQVILSISYDAWICCPRHTWLVLSQHVWWIESCWEWHNVAQPAACLDNDGDDTNGEQVRALDRAIRWNTFLFAVSALWADIINSSMGMTSTWTQIPPSLLATMSEVHPEKRLHKRQVLDLHQYTYSN